MKNLINVSKLEALLKEIDSVNRKHVYDAIVNTTSAPFCLYESRNDILRWDISEDRIQSFEIRGYKVEIYEHIPTDEKYHHWRFYSVKISQ